MTQPGRVADLYFLESLREAHRIINEGGVGGSMAAVAALSLLVKSFSGLVEELWAATTTESRSRWVTLEERLHVLESDGQLPKAVLGDCIALMRTHNLWAHSSFGLELMTLDLEEELTRLSGLTRWFLTESQRGPHLFQQDAEGLI